MKHQQRGRSLVELMVAMVIGLIVVGSVWLVYMATSRTSGFSNAVNRMNEDAMIAMSLIGDQFKMAGYSVPRAIYSPNTIVVGGVQRRMPDKNFNGAAVHGCDKGFVSHSVDHDQLTCKASNSAASAAFAIRYEADAFHALSAAGVPVDCLGQRLASKNAVSDFDDSEYWLVENRFFITNSEGVNHLSCAGNGNNFVSQPLVPNVEAVHVSYGITDGIDVGRAISYMTSAQMNANNISWEQVVSAKVCLVMRSESAVLEESANTTGCAGENISMADLFFRKVYVNTFAIRNKSQYLGKL